MSAAVKLVEPEGSNPTGPSPEYLASLGVQTQDDASENAFARVLIIGPPKVGKSTAVLATAPKVFHINCDGPSSTKGAFNLGANFLTAEAYNRRDWIKACKTAARLVTDGHCATVMVDSLTLLVDNIVDDASLTLGGHELWKEVADKVVGGVKSLMGLGAHLFVIAHMQPGKEGESGILPSVAGSSGKRVPALLDDWVLFDAVAGRQPHERMFQLGMQGAWSASGRNIRRSIAVQATVPALLDEMGIKL